MTDPLELSPYPKALVAEPSAFLSRLADKGLCKFRIVAFESACVDMDHREILMAGRFLEGILFKWAPAEIVNYRVCRDSLTYVTVENILSSGKFDDGGEDSIPSDNLKKFIVCAPPLNGGQAFTLTNFAWRDFHAVRSAFEELENLSTALSWPTSYLSNAAITFAFRQLENETTGWQLESKATVLHPQTYSRIYTSLEPNYFSDKISRMIQEHTRIPKLVNHHRIPAINIHMVQQLRDIAVLAKMNQDEMLVAKTIAIMLSNPRTLTCVSASESLTCVNMLKIFNLVEKGEHRYESEKTLEILFQEELMSAGPHVVTKARLDSPFVFDLASAYTFAIHGMQVDPHIYPPAETVTNLDIYLGGYLNMLDLSKSYITGSAAMSSVLRPPNRNIFSTHAAYLDSYYPTTYTILDKPKKFRQRVQTHAWYGCKTAPFTFEAVDSDGKTRTVRRSIKWADDDSVYNYTVISGTDVDIAVDAEGIEFDAIAQKHFDVVNKYFPSTTLVRIERVPGLHMYRIESNLPVGVEKGFRVVEIYQAPWSKICKHHVGMVRLAYTGASPCDYSDAIDAQPPKFYLTASCLMSAIKLGTPNYFCFASRNSTPHEIMMKYAVRGFPPLFLPNAISQMVFEYAQTSPRWNYEIQSWEDFARELPAIKCLGNYNVEAFYTEMNALDLCRHVLV